MSCSRLSNNDGSCSYLSLADLLELRKLRKAREGIDVAKLSKGDVKKKKKRPREAEGDQGGLKPGVSHDPEEYGSTTAPSQ